MPPIAYDQHPPSPILAPYVECYWTLRGGPIPDDRSDHAERVLPDGRVEIVLNGGGPVIQTRAGVAHRQPATLLVGPTTRAVLIRPTGTVDMFGIRLRHGSASAVLGVPAATLTDTMHPLDAVVGFPSSMREQLAESSGFAAQVAIVERHLLARVTRARHGSARSTAAAVARILTLDGAIEISRLASAAGISTRQLARRFGREVGVGPKLLARLARFHALLRTVETDRPRTLAAAAARTGYVDQSHLVRDFREFAGLAPSAWFRSQHRFSAYFLDLDPDGQGLRADGPTASDSGLREI